MMYTREKFIEKAKTYHKNKYDYSKVKYTNNRTKVLIKCCLCNENFLQTPNSHLNGNGCPNCRESKLEKSVEKILKEKEINYEKQKKFEWLKNDGDLKLDFYLSDYNIAIECQGVQHYKPVDFGNKGIEFAENEYKKTVKRDNIKKTLCEAHNINVMYIKYDMTKNEKYFLIEKLLITDRRVK